MDKHIVELLVEDLERRSGREGILLHYFVFMIVYLLIRIAYRILQPGKATLRDEWRYFVGMVYLNFVLALTLTPLYLNFSMRVMKYRMQLVPFDTVTRYWPLDGEYSLYNIVGNFLLMFPMLPVLTYSFRVQSLKSATLFTAFFIIAIELLQLVLTATRATDIDDFILNFGGFIVSIFIWKSVKRLRLAH